MKLIKGRGYYINYVSKTDSSENYDGPAICLSDFPTGDGVFEFSILGESFPIYFSADDVQDIIDETIECETN